MLNINEKYGKLHIQGKCLDIDKLDMKELEGYLQEMEGKRNQLIEEQNEYLSQIIG